MIQNINEKVNIIVVLGPTASGKTSLASNLAYRLNTEIISADSRQVYRGMDIGTGKDYEDYIVKGKKVPVHLIDIAEPGEKYNVFEYQKDFFRIFNELRKKEIIPVLCGGTGMYIDSVLRAYKLLKVPVNEKLRENLKHKSLDELKTILTAYKKLHNRSDTDTKKRAIRAIEIADYYSKNKQAEEDSPEIFPVIFGTDISRDKRRKNISKRLKQRIDEGMIKEAKRLHRQGLSLEDMMYYGLEYKYLALYLKGDLNLDEMYSQLETAIHQFAKRQMTWFRKMEREGYDIKWIDTELPMEEKINVMTKYMSQYKPEKL